MAQTSGKLRETKEEEKDALAPQTKENPVPVVGWQQKLARASRFVSLHYWILCILVGGIALAFNFYHSGTLSMWFDEILSVERGRQSLPVLLQIIMNSQPNMAFYYILMHFWLGLTALLGWNPTEIVVRSPSAVFAAASSVMVFLLGRRFLGIVPGLVAAGLYLLNGLQLTYAQDTRSYALQLLLICFAWYALFTIMTTDAHQKRWWLYFGLAMVLAIYSQLFSFLILAAQTTTFVALLLIPGPWRAKMWHQFLNAAGTLIGIFVLTLPMIYASRHGSKTGWLPAPHLRDIYRLFLSMSAGSKIYLYLLLAVIALGLVVVVIAYFAPGRRLLTLVSLIEANDNKDVEKVQQWFPIALGLLFWIIVSIILSYVISQTPTRLFSSRYLVTIMPPFVLLVGLGLAVLSIPRVRVPARGAIHRAPTMDQRAAETDPSMVGVPLAGTLARGRGWESNLSPLWRLIQVMVGVGLLLLTLHYVPFYYQQIQPEDWNVTTFWLEQHYQPNDGLVCFDNSQGCQLSVEYYLTAYPTAAHFTSDSPGSFPWAQNDLTGNPGNVRAAVDPQALATFGTHHPRIFFIIGRLSGNTDVALAKAARQWLDTHYNFITQIVTKSVTIRLYGTSQV
jgi:uncharacterized membrane protein